MIQPPYPADTRAKGWRFELDLEQVQQSDTWALASAELRPWLLMLWAVAWQQVPCGSMPSDDALICARLGMPRKLYAKEKDTLMRGWSLAEDGRLYHSTITSRVLDMLKRKDAERTRKAEYRTRMEAMRTAAESRGSPQVSHGTDAGRTPESGGSDATGTGTGTGLNTNTPSSLRSEGGARKAQPTHPRPDGVDEQVWADWLKLRKAKRAPVTQTVLDGARVEADKAGMTLEAFLRVWCRRGSQGLEAAWLKPDERQPATSPTKTFRERDAEVARADFDRLTGRAPRREVIDITPQTLELPHA